MFQITLQNHEEASIPMMQGDTDYQIEVTTHESLTEKMATVDIETMSGNVLQIDASKVTIDELNNTITFTVDTQTTGLAGQYKAQISVYKKSEPTKLVSYYPLTLNVSSAVKPITSPYETAVSQVKELVDEGYKLAESWAHGSTGVRDGEDTDNAKYYAEQAKTAYEDIADTNEAKLSNRISAIESGYTINQISLGTINHNLNKYPRLDGYNGTYGAGISAGANAGGSDVQHVTLYWICTDKNNLTVYCDKHVIYDENGTQLTVDAINKVNDYHYTVTFKNGASKSIQIILD